MAIDVVKDLLISVSGGTFSSAIVIFVGKIWLEKSIGHSFDKKIETFKSLLGKENIGYQIDKAEFSKKKFEQVTDLYLTILERKRRTEIAYDLFAVNNLPEVRKRFDENYEFDRKMRESISIASLFLDDSLIKSINSYIITHHFVFIHLVEIAEHDILTKYPLQKRNIKYKVVQNTGFDSKKTYDSLNKNSKQLIKDFENINLGFKKFLTVE